MIEAWMIGATWGMGFVGFLCPILGSLAIGTYIVGLLAKADQRRRKEDNNHGS